MGNLFDLQNGHRVIFFLGPPLSTDILMEDNQGQHD
jgi:hypothetical protein